MSSLGEIWPRRARAACAPKSGEHALQTAPMLALARNATIASTPLPTMPATRSPDTMPASRMASAQHSTWRVQLPVAHLGAHAILRDGDQGRVAVATPQEVLCVVQARPWKPLRAGHAVGSLDALGRRVEPNVREFGVEAPKRFPLVHRPAVQRGVVVERPVRARLRLPPEPPKLRVLTGVRRWTPQRFGAIHASGSSAGAQRRARSTAARQVSRETAPKSPRGSITRSGGR